MYLRNIFIISLLLIFTSSCNPDGTANKKNIGTGMGAVIGGLAGAAFGKGDGKIATVAIGALAGSMLGNTIGAQLDQADKENIEKSSHRALEFAPSKSTIEWQNPDSGNSGNITPINTFKQGNQYCREYVQKVYIGGEEQTAYGKACRKPDGTWQIVQNAQ